MLARRAVKLLNAHAAVLAHDRGGLDLLSAEWARLRLPSVSASASRDEQPPERAEQQTKKEPSADAPFHLPDCRADHANDEPTAEKLNEKSVVHNVSPFGFLWRGVAARIFGGSRGLLLLLELN